jgi:hypothetical protein
VGGGFNDVSIGCQRISDAGAPDVRLKDPLDAMTVEVGAPDAQAADLMLKPPTDATTSDVSVKPPLDDAAPEAGAGCTAGEHRCRSGDSVVQTCSTDGQWRDELACPYVCSAGTCIGECTPGLRRRCRPTGNVPQDCDSAGAWIDETACSGSTPYCATGQCVAACLSEGQDCTDPKTACCAGSECVSVTDRTFTCKAIPDCASLGSTCAANADCCAGLDCTAGKCAAKNTSCFDRPDDGVCGGTSVGTCCPGTVCGPGLTSNALGCALPTTAKPQEGGCPRDQPALHEACRATKVGLNCTYSDWSKLPGVFFYCTCSYHGWSCTKGNFAH